MANETQIVSKGWAWAWLSRKPHYFINGRSLCGKWVLFSDMLEQESGKRSPDDCAVCRKKLDRLAEAAALMANETQIVSKGWAWAWLSRKPHYFINGRSLCGKWALFSDILEQESGKRSPDDCAVCRKKLDRLAEAAALAAALADAGAGGERDA